MNLLNFMMISTKRQTFKENMLTQEKSKFNEFYSMFQRLFFYLKYHDKQLIINL